MELVNELLFAAVKAVLLALVPVIGAWARGVYQKWARERDWDLLFAWVRESVLAAEQLGLTGELERRGMAKLDFVVERVEVFLRQQGLGIDLDAEEIRAMVESYVFRLAREVARGE